jgi:hypothetical protein
LIFPISEWYSIIMAAYCDYHEKIISILEDYHVPYKLSRKPLVVDNYIEFNWDYIVNDRPIIFTIIDDSYLFHFLLYESNYHIFSSWKTIFGMIKADLDIEKAKIILTEYQYLNQGHIINFISDIDNIELIDFVLNKFYVSNSLHTGLLNITIHHNKYDTFLYLINLPTYQINYRKLLRVSIHPSMRAKFFKYLVESNRVTINEGHYGNILLNSHGYNIVNWFKTLHQLCQSGHLPRFEKYRYVFFKHVCKSKNYYPDNIKRIVEKKLVDKNDINKILRCKIKPSIRNYLITIKN